MTTPRGRASRAACSRILLREIPRYPTFRLFQIDHIYGRHAYPFFDFLTMSSPFAAPGTAPRTNNRFSSGLDSMTFNRCTLRVPLPYVPEGSCPSRLERKRTGADRSRGAMEHGTVRLGSTRIVVPSTTPWNPFPLDTPITSTQSPFLKMSTFTVARQRRRHPFKFSKDPAGGSLMLL